MENTNKMPVRASRAYHAVMQDERPTFVSNKYAFIKTAPIIEQVLAAGFGNLVVKTAKSRLPERQGFEKHQLTFTHATQGADSDSVLRCLVRNSHDRSSALEFHLGFYRFACENGLIVGSSIIGSFKVYHTGNIEQKISETIASMLSNVPKVLETRANMRNRILSLETESLFVNEANKLIGEIRDIEVSTTNGLYNPRRIEDEAQDLWTVFNRIQEAALGALVGIRSSVNDKGDVTRKVIRARKVKSLDIDTKLNTKLFDLALRYL